MERDEQLCLYFDCALENVSEGNNVIEVELLKYTCHNWRSDFCTEQRRLLKQETFKLL